MNNTETVYTIDAVIEKIMEENKQYDLSKIVSAYECAAKAHANQVRSSGEPYITHPLAVSYILLELGMDTDTICAGMLHDVVEDTDTTLEEIKKNFGQDVAMLVDGVTKLGKIPLFTKEEQQAENVRKILLAMSQDIRVIIIKLADRLHNMRTLQFRPAEKQRATALETMNIYAPIAHRLGIRAIQDEIEDLSFRYLDPYAYSEIEQMLKIRSDERQAFIRSIEDQIMARFKELGAGEPQLSGRVKSVYGIYRKAFVNGKSIDEIYDIYAVRIVVDTVVNCYNALGIIHDMYNPLPNRFKDYIATPKANMYQSLHTTVIGSEGIPFEVQIRTVDMNYTAEYGIAAHWKYKEGIKKDKLESRLAWIRKIIEAQQESNDAEEIVRTIKSDLSPEDTFAFTPKGDIITLPAGATIIDFAYAIHSEVGNKMKGAKVDGKLVSLDYKLQTGEIVEILTSNDPNHGPNRAWLDIARTNEARSKIRSWFKKERREENIETGRTKLLHEFSRNSIDVPEDELDDFLADDMKRHNCATLDDYYAAVGYGGIILDKILPRLKDLYTKRYGTPKPTPLPFIPMRSNTGIVVGGESNIDVKLSKCCNPLPGEDIIGFITKGHGVSVHRRDCPNYIESMRRGTDKDRWVDVVWAENVTTNDNPIFKATLDIVAYGSITLIADIATVTAEMRVPVANITSRILKNGNTNIILTCSIAGSEQLHLLITKLRKLPDVISADRIVK
ncbi:MAG: bifunctional (p)ppGpp synthetase/guanosine-3',5'-bis(diphosphate) 3'-pyrophosphohydrolase [Oscillospiraceae bacterium]|nr:bifunctional (p)ppGpp synthetase/guanosine-3',5'-bis(diphosphate) 3'-pyrophosphohydrolase [Oscillospiraceae bacterium]MBQ8979312.1 bifunctional (p)ppGpp synthetase/guanosine-3',5'-bis(diphosphate) 3'-pyrophosphohydrolase [Oscillospiraceae bacterium]